MRIPSGFLNYIWSNRRVYFGNNTTTKDTMTNKRVLIYDCCGLEPRHSASVETSCALVQPLTISAISAIYCQVKNPKALLDPAWSSFSL